MKIVYIAHPIGGDVYPNIQKVLDLVKHINLTMYDVVPFAPYIVDCLALDDNDYIQRARGMMNDHELFKRGFIDELWLCGDHISYGMQAEKQLAESLGIKVINMIGKLWN